MKITKILVALSFLFAVSTANAGEMTVTGSMETTYNSQGGNVTGNPLGMDRELKFSASTELDNGMTVSVMQDTSDALAFGDGQITFGNVAGMMDVYVGADGSPVDAIDDVTPSAYEEAWGSGAGTINDIGGLAGNMGIGIKTTLPVLGALNAKFVPKADGSENADNANSAATNSGVGKGESVSLKTNLGDLPFVGGYLSSATLTTGYEQVEGQTLADTADTTDLTAALNITAGNFAFGIQRKSHQEAQATATTEQTAYKDLAIGISYSINDELSVSYNRYDSQRSLDTSVNPEQEITAFNIGYSVGGMTIGIQDASTNNAGWVLDAEDDSRTIGISVAF